MFIQLIYSHCYNMETSYYYIDGSEVYEKNDSNEKY